MTGWELGDLSKLLESARDGDKEQVEKLVTNNSFAKTNKDFTKLLVMRKFHAKQSSYMPDPIISIEPPTDEHFQWGISIITTPDDGEVDFPIYIPNKYTYTGIEFTNDEITILSKEMTKKTNIRELHKKLRKFCPMFKQSELEIAFDSLNNEIYKPKKVPKPVKTEKVIENSFLGTLTYNETYNWYDNNGTSKYFPFELNINYEAPHKFPELLRHVETKMKENFYEQHLLEMEPEMIALKNDSWLEENEERITPEKFRKLVYINSIVFYDDKSCTIYCNDGDLFGEHTIDISIGKNGKYKGVSLAG